jgi:Domain of unknown function (DUF4184)
MPFPLAHPAAVLPLRRYCPRWLNFPALVIGSLAPDAGYFFGEQHMGPFSHGLAGSFGFCLPFGLVMVALFYWLRSPALKFLPGPYQRALLPLCQGPRPSLSAVVLSLMIGTWSHQLWDEFTHTDGWAVRHLPLLKAAVFTAFGHTARVCHVLWYGCSFLGVICVFLAFEKWKRASVPGGAAASGWAVLRDAVLVAILVLPIELTHHLVRHHQPGMVLLAAVCALPITAIALRLGNPRRAAPPTTFEG